MNRSTFLKNILPTTLATVAGSSLLAQQQTIRDAAAPPFLYPGDSIGITCPAGAIQQQEAIACQSLLARWGFRTVMGSTIGKQWMVFGGTDEERAADLQALINNPEIKAIISGRGGYGVMRILDRIDFSPLKSNPKWMIGFSDITALHCHLHQQFGLPTIHADMASGLNETLDSSAYTLYEILTGSKAVYTIPPSGYNRTGRADGLLVGGNLSMVVAMMGSTGELDTAGKILFLEDVREYKYTIDRMLMTLKRAGKLDQLAGLLLGGFTRLREDNGDDFAMNIGEIIMEKVAAYPYPVCFNFPAGHQTLNMAMQLGARHRLVVEERICTLQAG